MKTSKKYGFSMVEIALAMAVIAIAIVSIMGVLPVAMRAGKNSVADNSVTNVAELMKVYLDSKYRAVSDLEAFEGLWPNNKNTPSGDLANTLMTENDAMQIFYKNSIPGHFRVELYSGNLADTAERNTDFSASVKVWVTPLAGEINIPFGNPPVLNLLKGTKDDNVSPEAKKTSINMEWACTVFMKISYPAEASEANQEHRLYSFDYFRK